MLPVTAAEEVESPENDRASPVSVIGKEVVRLVSLDMSIDVPKSAVTFPFKYVRPPE
jgi:hypothetical protein